MTSDKQSAGEYMYKLDSLGYTFNKNQIYGYVPGMKI